MSPNKQSQLRAEELTSKTVAYRTFKQKMIEKEQENRSHFITQRDALLAHFQATLDDWNNWHWQMHHRITDLETLVQFIPLSKKEQSEIKQVITTNRFAIVPYYLALISTDKTDPIKALSIPQINEILDTSGETDPMAEEFTNPAGSITRRYPDRLIINVTNICAMYCRHCQRRRLIGESDHHTSEQLISDSIEYIKHHEEIRDVLITGGDALLLSDSQIETILKQIRAIKHVEIIRLGSRTPVTMPMRITSAFADMVAKYHPVYLNTHFNHPQEVTPESQKACETLSNHGIIIGNQAVLLKGINDDHNIMTYLNQKLLQIRVRPYYIFHAKSVRGTSHFIPSLRKGLEIMEFMRGFTSGLAIPTYIMNAPGGLGKVPLLPEYIIDQTDDVYTIRTWENKTFKYKNSE